MSSRKKEDVPEFQTRSEINGVSFYPTFKKAFIGYTNDKTVWKISFGGHRWRPKRRSDTWSPFSERKLEEISGEYKNCDVKGKVFWVDQRTIGPNYDVIESYNISLIDKSVHHSADCLVECITEEEFIRRYTEK